MQRSYFARSNHLDVSNDLLHHQSWKPMLQLLNYHQPLAQLCYNQFFQCNTFSFYPTMYLWVTPWYQQSEQHLTYKVLFWPLFLSTWWHHRKSQVHNLQMLPKTLWLMNVVRKIHYTQTHMLLGNSNAKSLQIVLSPDCSDMNAFLWTENFPFGFQSNTLKHYLILWSKRLCCWLETNCLSFRLFIGSSIFSIFFVCHQTFASKFHCLFQLFHLRVCIVCGTGILVFTSKYLCNFWWWRFTWLLWWNIHLFHWQFFLSLLFLIGCGKGRENCWNWVVIQSVPNFSWSDNKTGWFKLVTTDKAAFVWYPVFSFHRLNPCLK